MISLSSIYKRLNAHFGHRNWWPGDSRLEICIGAMLTQNTNWGNVEKAIANLKAEELIDLDALLSLSVDQLAERIRPAGYYNVKAKRLRNLLAFLSRHGGKEYKHFRTLGDMEFREKLLAVNGVGQETADSILLYAFERPFFVIDAYTRRIFSRLGFSDPSVGYEELQAMFMRSIPKDVALYNDYHAQIVALGHYFCRPKPLCPDCLLQSICRRETLDRRADRTDTEA